MKMDHLKLVNLIYKQDKRIEWREKKLKSTQSKLKSPKIFMTIIQN